MPPSLPSGTAPRYGRRFVNRSQWHSCGRFTAAEHFRGSEPRVRALYERFTEAVRACAPVSLAAARTRIGFQARTIFVDVVVRRRWLHVYFCLDRRFASPRFTRVEALSPRHYVHHFRLADEAEIDDELMDWLRAMCAVGARKAINSMSSISNMS